MAYYYTLAVECGESIEDVNLCCQHFDTFKSQIDDNIYNYITEYHKIEDEGKIVYWVVVFSLQLPTSGVVDESTAHLFTVIGNDLLKHLASFSHFRFAILGVEAMEAIQFTAFKESLDMNQKFIDHFNGLVISKAMLSTISNKEVFITFSPQHVAIIPYRVKWEE